MLTGRSDLRSAQLRETGFRRALAAAGVPLVDGVRGAGRLRRRRVGPLGARVAGPPDRPTAVFAANDLSAIATVEVARELGLRVPQDLSVVGFDNIPESALCTPPLTTVDQPIREMGHRAIEMLIDLIGDADPHDRRPGRAPKIEAGLTHQTLDTSLVIRASTGAP